MYFRNFTTLFVKYSYLYFSSHGVYGSKVKKRNKHQYVNECHLISYHWSNMGNCLFLRARGWRIDLQERKKLQILGGMPEGGMVASQVEPCINVMVLYTVQSPLFFRKIAENERHRRPS